MIVKACWWQLIAGVIQVLSYDLAIILEPCLPALLAEVSKERIRESLTKTMDEFVTLASDTLFKIFHNSLPNPVDLKAEMSKYSDAGGFLGEFGNSKDFEAGLEAKIGLPDPNILKAMIREHISANDSDEPFETTNYKILTTSSLEFALLLGNSQEYYNAAEHAPKKIPVVLQEIADGKYKNRGINLGPKQTELKELEPEFAKLKNIFNGKKNIPGTDSDTFCEQQVQIAVPKPAGMDNAGSNMQLEKFMLEKLISLPFFKSACNHGRKFGKVSSALTSEKGITSMTISLPLNVAQDEVVDEVKKAVSQHLNLKSSEIEVLYIGTHNYSYTKGEERSNESEKENITVNVRKQARTLRSLRQLMDVADVSQANLRVEEAIAAYQYTGPLFQVWHWISILFLYLVFAISFWSYCRNGTVCCGIR